MSLQSDWVTVTAISTTTVDVDPSVVTILTTTTEQSSTTISATPGEVVTISSGPVISSQLPTTRVFPSLESIFTSTTTATEIDVYFQGPFGAIYSTWTFTITAGSPQVTSNDGGFIYTVHSNCHGWDCWSPGAKAGLIVGVILAGLLILFLLIRCLKARNEWIAHDWRWARHVEGGGPNPNMNIVPTVRVVGGVYPTPYGYAA